MSLRCHLITAVAILMLTWTSCPGRTAGEFSFAGVIPAAAPATGIIDEDDFQTRLLAWSYFQALAERPEVMIIDVRSGFTPAGDPPGLNNLRPIPLEIFRVNFIARRVHQDKMLLILDKSGNELRGLYYHLIKNGYHDFYFLEGGAEAAQRQR